MSRAEVGGSGCYEKNCEEDGEGQRLAVSDGLKKRTDEDVCANRNTLCFAIKPYVIVGGRLSREMCQGTVCVATRVQRMSR